MQNGLEVLFYLHKYALVSVAFETHVDYLLFTQQARLIVCRHVSQSFGDMYCVCRILAFEHTVAQELCFCPGQFHPSQWRYS